MNDDALPFSHKRTDLHEGMGHVATIVDLSEFADTPCQSVTSDGRCNWCGYDRGVKETHTEIEGYSLECHHCKTTLERREP